MNKTSQITKKNYQYLGNVENADESRTLVFKKELIVTICGKDFVEHTLLEKVRVHSIMEWAKEMVARGFIVEFTRED